MAVRKAILDIDLGGDKLKQALATLQQYHSLASRIPRAVAAAGRSVVAAAGRGVAAGGRAVAGAAWGPTPREREDVRFMTAAWRSIGNDAGKVKSMLQSIPAATGNLLRWTGIFAAAKGLLIGGSVWGLERLASSAYAGRRSSTGLGINYGEQTAFGLAYERLINSHGLLQGVSQARGNLSSEAAGALYALGINPQGAGNTGSMSNDVLARVRELAQQTPESELGILLQSRKLGELGFGVEDLRRLRGTSDEEFGQYQSDYARRTKQLDLQDSTLRRWQDLDVQLEAASQKLKNSFLVALEALAQPLGNLSEALGNFFQSIAGSEGVKKGIDYLAKGITYLGDYIGKDEFKRDVKLFVDSVGMLADKTVAALRLLGIIPDPSAAAGGGGNPQLLQNTPGHWLYKPPGGSRYNGTVEGSPVITETRAEQRKSMANRIWDAIVAPFTGGQSPEMENYMKAIKLIESGSMQGDYTATGPWVNGDRAYGAYQIMGRNIPEWSKRALGREVSKEEFINSPAIQDEIFRKIFGEMVRKYGNPQDAASEWHSGVDLRTAVRQGRSDGYTTTGDYVNRFNRGLTQQGVSININNNTGGNATVTVAPMGLGAPNY